MMFVEPSVQNRDCAIDEIIVGDYRAMYYYDNALEIVASNYGIEPEIVELLRDMEDDDIIAEYMYSTDARPMLEKLFKKKIY